MIKNEVYSCFRKMFLMATFLLLAGLPAFADDDWTVVNNNTAGALSTAVGDNKSTITNLKVSGSIDRTDIILLADMAKNGTLSVLDLSGATAEEGCLDVDAFYECTKLTSISLPQNVTSIGNWTFYGCIGLTSVTIPNSVESIKTMAFYNCSSLTEVILQRETLPTCGLSAFDGISSGATLYCPLSLVAACKTDVTDGGWNTFKSFASTVTLTSEKHLQDYITSDDIKNSITKLTVSGEINSTDIALLKTMAKDGTLSVIDLSGATAEEGYLDMEAFYECTKLTSISLPQNVTSIGNWAFYGCIGLTSVTIPDEVESIGEDAFYDCIGLTSVTIPNSVTSIDQYAFAYCSSLTSVTIGKSVTSIGNGAFMYCSKLEEVTLRGKVFPICGTDVFESATLSSAQLYYREVLETAFTSADTWNKFTNNGVKKFSITIPAGGYATGCFYDDLDFTNETKVAAYIVSAFSPKENTVLLTRAKKIPAETGFVVYGTPDTYDIPATTTDYVYSNMLVSVVDKTTISQTDGEYTNYVLRKDAEGNVAFVIVPANETVTVSDYKAYLQVPTSAVSTSSGASGSEAKTTLSLSFDDDDDTTGISEIKEQHDRTSGTTVIYNLNGQRKQSLTKGLNIVNGKKIFIK